MITPTHLLAEIAEIADEARAKAEQVYNYEQEIGKHREALDSLREGLTKLERRYYEKEYDGKNAQVRDALRQTEMDDDETRADVLSTIAAREHALRDTQIKRDYAERVYKLDTALLRAYGGNV